MRASPSWLSGLADRAGASRIERLQATRPARKLKALIAGLDPSQIRQLLVYSEINHDQALSALRLTLVANISVPVGLLVLFNQFLPGSIQAFIGAMPTAVILIPLFSAVSLLVGVLWFAYAGVDAARDLNHLLRLNLAGSECATAGEGGAAFDALDHFTASELT